MVASLLIINHIIDKTLISSKNLFSTVFARKNFLSEFDFYIILIL